MSEGVSPQIERFLVQRYGTAEPMSIRHFKRLETKIQECPGEFILLIQTLDLQFPKGKAEKEANRYYETRVLRSFRWPGAMVIRCGLGLIQGSSLVFPADVSLEEVSRWDVVGPPAKQCPQFPTDSYFWIQSGFGVPESFIRVDGNLGFWEYPTRAEGYRLGRGPLDRYIGDAEVVEAFQFKKYGVHFGAPHLKGFRKHLIQAVRYLVDERNKHGGQEKPKQKSVRHWLKELGLS